MNSYIIKNNENTTILVNALKKSAEQYPPLNKKQEQELIKKYKDDRETLNRLLFLHNIRAVFNFAKKYKSKTTDFDSMVQDGMIGLGEAIKRFDISMNIKFITYGLIWIRKYILARFYGKTAELDKRSTSLNSIVQELQLKSNNGNEVTLESYINDKLDPIYNRPKTIEQQLSANEQEDICKKLMDFLDKDNSLSSTDKLIFKDIIYNKEKPSELSLKYQVDKAYITGIKTKILSKFKNILRNQYSITSYNEIA